MSQKALKQLNTRKATVVPFWWALWVMFKYRSKQNFKQLDYLSELPVLPSLVALNQSKALCWSHIA